ncbi:E3 ubiquitin ligase RNF157 isoform X3 [Athalia rosae]|uniref:E3 ubiquitin ligase RNF157 isoform X3 n=1 Tax=Athalia rosae TaxID=37344 RepID=UPI000626D850|nr:E3 ubiquitin ligase RNF157 isoform X3 [Athalia rosae]
MGSLTSRQNAGVEEVDIVSNHAYKYPPRSGSYFGSHFIMGGERFDTPQPEAYLFGENADLNFLGSRPTPFPYPPPQANDPTKTLKSLINIRKESLRLIRAIDQTSTSSHHNSKHYGDGDADYKPSKFNIEFTFDCDVRCAITIYYFCTEDVTANGVVYIPRDPSMNSETYHYKKGANQQFSQSSHIFDPTLYNEEDLLYNPDRELISMAIHCVAEEGAEEPKQSHTTIAVIEKHSDGSYVLKALKQKLFVDGLCYLLQEIYGIENKNSENAKQQGSDEDTEDSGSECVICMCDVRDTLILPCRHLCLCNGCADSLRYQANNCPICRAPFRALLQIKALQKATGVILSNPPLAEGSCENIPSGYEAVSLIEALNGPYTPRATVLPMESLDTPDADTASAIQAAEILNRDENSGSQKDLRSLTPATRAKVVGRPRDKTALRTRDTLRLVNEKQSTTIDEGQDDDSEAEKLSPLLDAATSTEALDAHLHPIHNIEPIDDLDIDDELQVENGSTKIPDRSNEKSGH